jgi:hypothetical protein
MGEQVSRSIVPTQRRRKWERNRGDPLLPHSEKEKGGSKWRDLLFPSRDVENGGAIEEIHCSHTATKKKGEQVRRSIAPTQQHRKKGEQVRRSIASKQRERKGGTSEEIQCQTLCEYILFACCKYCNVTDQCRQKYYRLIWQIMESYCYCLSPWGNYYVRTLHIYTNIYYIGVFLYEQDRLLHKQGILEEPRLMFVW